MSTNWLNKSKVFFNRNTIRILARSAEIKNIKFTFGNLVNGKKRLNYGINSD